MKSEFVISAIIQYISNVPHDQHIGNIWFLYTYNHLICENDIANSGGNAFIFHMFSSVRDKTGWVK